MTINKLNRFVKWALAGSFAITIAGWGALNWYLWCWGWNIYTIVGITFTTVIASLILGICTGIYAIVQSALKHKIVTMEQILS
jgi:MFS superfamily sulfate permease-like transporter